MTAADAPSASLLHAGLLAALDTLRLLTLPLLIALPGLALARWLAPSAGAPWWRLAWGLGAGMVGLLLGRVLFQAVGVSDPWAWVALLMVLSLVALVRVPALQRPDPVAQLLDALGRRQVLLLAAAVAIAVGAVALGRAGAVQASQKAYTELWAVPDAQGLRIGVRNREGQATGYRVEVRREWQTQAEWTIPPLPNGATDEHHVLPGPVQAGAYAEAWQILLYRAGEPQVYRHVSLKR